MSIKKYDITIYGRTNTTISSIRGKKLYNEIALTTSKNKAKAEALNNFYMLMDDMWKALINRRDIRVKCELVSWLIDWDDKEMIYINEMLK